MIGYPVINDKFFSFSKVHFSEAKFIAEFENQSEISQKALEKMLLAIFVTIIGFSAPSNVLSNRCLYPLFRLKLTPISHFWTDFYAILLRNSLCIKCYTLKLLSTKLGEIQQADQTKQKWVQMTDTVISIEVLRLFP